MRAAPTTSNALRYRDRFCTENSTPRPERTCARARSRSPTGEPRRRSPAWAPAPRPAPGPPPRSPARPRRRRRRGAAGPSRSGTGLEDCRGTQTGTCRRTAGGPRQRFSLSDCRRDSQRNPRRGADNDGQTESPESPPGRGRRPGSRSRRRPSSTPPARSSSGPTMQRSGAADKASPGRYPGRDSRLQIGVLLLFRPAPMDVNLPSARASGSHPTRVGYPLRLGPNP